MRVSAIDRKKVGEYTLQQSYTMTLTTPAEASADTVHTLLAADLVGDDMATLQDLLLDLGGIIQHDACSVASDGSDGGDREGLAIDDDRLPVPVGQ